MPSTKPRAARRQFPRLTREQRRQIRFEMAAGTTSTEIEQRGVCSASTARALRVGALHPEDGGPTVRMQLPPITKAARRKLLETALESRRIFGTDPKFADVQEAVAGEPRVLQGRRRIRVHKLLASTLRCIDKVLANIGPPDPVTGCKLWTGFTRKRSWKNSDDAERSVLYPTISDPADSHSLIDPKRVLATLSSIPLQPRQRIRMSCGDHMCMAVEHFVIGGERRG
jgi:hypothetical protein